MHAAAKQGREVAGEVAALDIEGVRVQLWRATGLERHVDAEALLRAEAPPEPPYWMHLWPGALSAARMAATAAAVGPGARVLEIGCGLALPAVLAAQRGAAVLATDKRHEPLVFARRSAALSGCAVEVLQMDWTAPALRRGFDLCIGADVGYDAAAEAGLVGALAACTAAHGEVWLTDSVNTARRSLAARLESAGFAVAERQMREWEDGRAVWVRVLTARRRG
jgi:predicted nicotinamide N-methyase